MCSIFSKTKSSIQSVIYSLTQKYINYYLYANSEIERSKLQDYIYVAKSERVIIIGILATCLDDRNQWGMTIFTLSHV